MPHIEAIRAQEILDSRGQPTVLAELRLDNGLCTQAIVQAGFVFRWNHLGSPGFLERGGFDVGGASSLGEGGSSAPPGAVVPCSLARRGADEAQAPPGPLGFFACRHWGWPRGDYWCSTPLALRFVVGVVVAAGAAVEARHYLRLRVPVSAAGAPGGGAGLHLSLYT